VDQRKFNRNPISAGIALALTSLALSSAALAQDAADAQTDNDTDDELVLETVVVTGIRASLNSAQDLKESADTFVDGLTADDIGALPDLSVAESLQRVPGVNIGRFQKTTDPDRFSVEGADVIIRGLPFVRSELNGRDVFSATGGTVLSFNEISPELLGRVLVYKNATADMIDGGIAGTVDLVTRKPLESDGPRITGSLEANYGDIAEEWSPAGSLLLSNSWDTNIGRWGLQAGFSMSELNTRSYASQVTDPCYRDASLDGPCIRAASVGSGGVGGEPGLGPDEFPPAGTVIVPKGAGVRTTGYERDRQTISLAGQWESNDGDLLVTAEYLRADAELFVDEHAMLALVNDDALFPTPAAGTNWTFNNGSFQSGVLSQVAWRGLDNCAPGSITAPENPDFIGDRPCLPQVGIPTELLRFQRQDESTTEDLSLDISWNATDRLRVNFEAQHLEADRTEDGFISAMATYADIFLDVSGDTPAVQFLPPTTTDGSTDPNYFTNPARTYYSFLLDSLIENDAEMDTLRLDLDYYFSDTGFIRDVQFGARWSDRNRVTRDNRFANWGALSFPWAGDQSWAENWEIKQAPVFAAQYGDAANIYNPFLDFQRGSGPVPVPNGAAWFFGGADMLGEYLSGLSEEQANEILNDSFAREFGVGWGPVANRAGVIPGTPFLPGEISDVTEVTEAAYVRFDFAVDSAIPITGNFGLRYVNTTIESDGLLQFPNQPPDPSLCDTPGPAGLPGFCQLSPAREAEFVAAYTGEIIPDDADISYDHWLPSLNIRFDVTDTLLIRAAASKGISRPDLAAYQTSGVFFDNTNTLRDEGTLETGPLFAVSTGNRLLVPIEAWNYDISAEWYFAEVGQLTATLFYKDFENLISNGATLRTFSGDETPATDIEVRGPANLEDGSLWGYELTYQQVFDFLPGWASGFGAQATYTYVDASDLSTVEDQVARQPFAADLGLRGISEDTINLVAFYETEVLSARLAYNWRSEYLITPRDDIFPFSPIYHEDTGQLDGSIFYNFLNTGFLENLQVGLQVANITDEVIQTSQVIDYDGTQFPRSAFRNDRRYTLVARFKY
jgi:TonB-dependent receptor